MCIFNLFLLVIVLSVLSYLRLLVTPLISSNFFFTKWPTEYKWNMVESGIKQLSLIFVQPCCLKNGKLLRFLCPQVTNKSLMIQREIIKIRKSKDRQRNGQKKTDKRTNNDLQNTTQKTSIRATRTPLKTGGELRCSGRVGSSCSTSDSRRVTLVTKPVVSHEWSKDREVLMTSGKYPWSFVTQIFRNGQPSHGGDRKTFEVMTST